MHTNKRFVLYLCVSVFIRGLFFSPSYAQVTASISGTVEDHSGASVRDATVTVKSLETGATRTVKTDGVGSFHIVSLALGFHQIKTEMQGFKTDVRDIDLALGQDAVVRLQLLVGNVDTVEITDEAPVVNTTT